MNASNHPCPQSGTRRWLLLAAGIALLLCGATKVPMPVLTDSAVFAYAFIPIALFVGCRALQISYDSPRDRGLLALFLFLQLVAYGRAIMAGGSHRAFAVVVTFTVVCYAIYFCHSQDLLTRSDHWSVIVLCIVILGVALAGAFLSSQFNYRGIKRWSGPWANPNIFGAVMATAFVGLSAWGLSKVRQKWSPLTWLAAAATCLSGLALVLSFSRGAWLGAIIGMLYAGWHWLRGARGQRILRPLDRLALCIVVCAGAVIASAMFQSSSIAFLRRIGSATNPLDFSWRNRVVAYDTALGMIASHPFLGFGWRGNEFEPYFRSRLLLERSPIELNDYLHTAVQTGCVTTVVFMAIIARILMDNGIASTGAALATRAVVACLAVVFFFDGGVYVWPTATIFWTSVLSCRKLQARL